MIRIDEAVSILIKLLESENPSHGGMDDDDRALIMQVFVAGHQFKKSQALHFREAEEATNPDETTAGDK